MTRTRAEFQRSEDEEPVAELARRYGLNPKTIGRWRNRDCVQGAPRSEIQALYEFKRQLFYDSPDHLTLRPYTE
jgi:transposase-like protein